MYFLHSQMHCKYSINATLNSLLFNYSLHMSLHILGHISFVHILLFFVLNFATFDKKNVKINCQKSYTVTNTLSQIHCQKIHIILLKRLICQLEYHLPHQKEFLNFEEEMYIDLYFLTSRCQQL